MMDTKLKMMLSKIWNGLLLLLKVRDQIENQVKNMIVNYRDDADLQNLVDWVQQDWVGAQWQCVI